MCIRDREWIDQRRPIFFSNSRLKNSVDRRSNEWLVSEKRGLHYSFRYGLTTRFAIVLRYLHVGLGIAYTHHSLRQKLVAWFLYMERSRNRNEDGTDYQHVKNNMLYHCISYGSALNQECHYLALLSFHQWWPPSLKSGNRQYLSLIHISEPTRPY